MSQGGSTLEGRQAKARELLEAIGDPAQYEMDARTGSLLLQHIALAGEMDYNPTDQEVAWLRSVKDRYVE